MTRARYALNVTMGLAIIMWWSPSLLLAWVGLLVDRLRFSFVIGLGAVLREVGAVGLAQQVYRAEADRAVRRMRAIQGRRRS